jgi:hypothetical protein
MNSQWTTLKNLRQELQRRWDRGYFWKAWFEDTQKFPYRYPLKKPATKDWAIHFSQVQEWAQEFAASDSTLGFSIDWCEVQHRTLGLNRIPSHAVFADLRQLAHFVKRNEELERFAKNAQLLLDSLPALGPWLSAHPKQALEDSEEWSTCIRMALWMRENPRPEIYLRQIPMAGMHTKFVEAHQGLLQTWLEALGLCADTEANSFASRFGFLEKPTFWRIRILDPKHFMNGFSDLTLRSDELAKWTPNVSNWIVVENDITALALPQIPDCAVLFGRGYGFHSLATISWLHQVSLFYWGDIDTHGFAILSQFRAMFPHTRSLLMDRETLLEHREQWVSEPKASNANLTHLNAEEATLYAHLVSHEFAPQVRLEQERIAYAWIEKYLESINSSLFHYL